MPAKLPDSERRNALELYLSGLSTRAIHEQTGRSEHWIAKVLRESGATRSLSDARKLHFKRGGWHNKARYDLPSEDIVRRYLAGESAQALAIEFGTESNAIHKRVRDAGFRVRGVAEAARLLHREQIVATVAKSRSRLVGWGEDILAERLRERGEITDLQRPEGKVNVDIAIPSVAVEVWLSSSHPFADAYCRERVKYLANRGWWCCYVFVSRRTRVLRPEVTDQIIALAQLARSNPSAPRQHWVVRGCGEIAAVAGDDLDDWTDIRPSVSCQYHRGINARRAN